MSQRVEIRKVVLRPVGTASESYHACGGRRGNPRRPRGAAAGRGEWRRPVRPVRPFLVIRYRLHQPPACDGRGAVIPFAANGVPHTRHAGGGGGHFHAYRQSDMPPHAPVSLVRRRNERLTVRSSVLTPGNVSPTGGTSAHTGRGSYSVTSPSNNPGLGMGQCS